MSTLYGGFNSKRDPRIDYSPFINRVHIQDAIERYRVFRIVEPSIELFFSELYIEFLFNYEIYRQELLDFIAEHLNKLKYPYDIRFKASEKATMKIREIFGVNPNMLRQRYIKAHYKEILADE